MILERWEDLLQKVVNEETVDYEDEAEQSWVEKVFYKELKALGRVGSKIGTKKGVKKVIRKVKRRR